MNCFKVRVPDERPLHGFTASGEPVPVYPGEYLVHCLRPRIDPGAPALLRFVGADALGRDVHVVPEPGTGLLGLPPGPWCAPPAAQGSHDEGRQAPNDDFHLDAHDDRHRPPPDAG